MNQLLNINKQMQEAQMMQAQAAAETQAQAGIQTTAMNQIL